MTTHMPVDDALPAPPERQTPRRAELFDDVVALFLAEGFVGFTLDQLAARLRCSKSTLYTLASSKEQLSRAAVVHFFRRAAEQIEQHLADVDPAHGRVATYLEAVARELAPAQSAFYRDLDAFPPAREIYELNTMLAARRVNQLIAEGVANGAYRSVHTTFAADLIAGAMTRIGRGDVARATGLDDAAAFLQLSDLMLRGLRA